MSDTAAPKSKKKQTDEEIVKEARARFQRCQDWESTARDNALQDIRFANGDERNNYQWGEAALTLRGDRPCLTYNNVRQHNLLIVNDARQHKAAIKVTPTGGGATYEAAQVYSAIVRRIEYQSKAMDAYSTAIYHQVESGIGYVRVVTEYSDDDSFDQEIFIRRISDPRTVWLDPDAKEYDKGDMLFAFVAIDTPRAEYEARNPDMTHEPPPFDYADQWETKDVVREAEYWRRDEKNDTLHLLADGTTVRESALPPGAKALLQIKNSRHVAGVEVECFKLAGNKIIERKVWPGRYIPIVPFIGEETVIDGVMDRKGHTRCMLSPQRMLNYWNSSAAEHVALQGKSPYLADVRSIEGYETYWAEANTVNHPYLPYNSKDPETGQELAPPSRAPAPVMAQAYIEGMSIARQDFREVSGQYQAQLGAPGNETSGVAIQQRQRQGDTATYHYIDNQGKGVRQVGRIIVDVAPAIYDVAQVMKIMAEDGTQSDIHLDPEATEAHQNVMPGQAGRPDMPITPDQAKQAKNDPSSPNPRVIFNPNVGKYDVEADVGPSFGTQREEAFNALSQIIQTSPDLVHIAGDLLFKSADFPLADELAERLKRMVPPQAMGGPGQEVQQMQAQMQHVQQAAQDTLGQADQHVAALKAENDALKAAAKDKSAGTTIDDYRAETDRLQAITAADPEVGKMLARSMLSGLLGMPALPVIHAHREADAAHGAMMAGMQGGIDPAAQNGAGTMPMPPQAQPPVQAPMQ